MLFLVQNAININGMNSAIWAHSIIDITNQTLTGATSLECISLTTTSRYCTVGGMFIGTQFSGTRWGIWIFC